MMKRILSRRLWVLAVVVSLLIATGCGGSQPAESQLGPLDKAEASQELSAAMAVWLPDNADKVIPVTQAEDGGNCNRAGCHGAGSRIHLP